MNFIQAESVTILLRSLDSLNIDNNNFGRLPPPFCIVCEDPAMTMPSDFFPRYWVGE